MRRLRISTCLWIIAGSTLPLAILAQVRASRTYHATRWVAVGPTPAAIGFMNTIGSKKSLMAASSDPAVAGISGLRGSADSTGLLANRLNFSVRPGTFLVGVAIDWETAAEASAIVDAVVAASPHGPGVSSAGPPVIVARSRPGVWLPAAGLVSLAYLLLAVAAFVARHRWSRGVTTRRPTTA